MTFRTRSGLLPVRRRDDEFVLDFPAYPAAPADAETAARVAEALGAQPREVVRARSLFAVLDDAAAVRAFAPDFGALAAAAHHHRHHRGGRRTKRGPSTSCRATSRRRSASTRIR